jgi:hypothetical protein
MRLYVVLLVTLVITLSGAPGLANTPKFEFGKFDEVKEVKDVDWRATAEAGVVFTTGNAETMTATGGIKASRRTGSNKLALEASAAYARSGLRVLFDRDGDGLIGDQSEIMTVDTVTAETLASKLRYDRFLTELNSIFVAALASRDTPAGKEAAYGGQLGYSRSLYKSKRSQTLAELGYDFSREDQVGGASFSIHSARAFVGHKSVMSEGVDLDTSAELLTNINRLDLNTTDLDGNLRDGGPLKDTRINARIAISAKLGANLAFQSALEFKFDNRPGPLPVKNLAPGFNPEAAKLDTIMRASFIYTFAGQVPEKK